MIQIKKYKPETSYIKTLIYGDTGAGKTTFAATAPRPLFVCVENGLLSVADKAPLMVEIKDLQDIKDIVKYLKELAVKKKGGEDVWFDTIVVDSLSAMAQTVKDKITNYGERTMTMRERWVLGDVIMGLFKQIINLPFNIIFIAHSQEEEDEQKGTKYYNLSLSGRSKNEVLRDFDVIGFISVNDKGERNINVKENSFCKAKCRSQALKVVDILPLDFSEWVKIVNEWTNFGESEVVQEIDTGVSKAPTTEVQGMWEKLETKLLEDKSKEAKDKWKQTAVNSKKIGEEEKKWICAMIDAY